MHNADPPGADRPPDFEDSFSRGGLLRRYVRGRVGHFASRQIMTAIGGLLLAGMYGPSVALLAVVVALIGEAVDCGVLLRIPGWLDRGVPINRLYALSTATAGFQAATISFCVGLVWFGENGRDAPLFPVAFLLGASINAALTMPHQRAATIVRLCVYGALTAYAIAMPLLARQGQNIDFAMNAAGVAILAYVIYSFLGFVNAGFRRIRRQTGALVEQSRVLEITNAQLRERQKEAQQLSLVARNANDSVILAHGDGRIFWTNDAFTRITGFTGKEVIGRRPSEFLNGPETDMATSRAIADAVAAGRPFRGEIQNMTRDGRRIWIETNLAPVLDEDGNAEVIVAIERDVTAAREHAAELEAARRAAEEGARAKAEFLATMSHEIRTPMNGVMGMADMLCETRLTDEQREITDTIRASAQALLTIINDVLDLSRLDAQKVEIHVVECDLHACLKDIVTLLCPQAHDKGLTLDLDLLAGLPVRVRADDGRLRQVLLNLIGNALKFTENGGVTIRAGASAAADGHVLGIEVEDTGIGIAEDKLAHVFGRFSQADAAITRRFGGTGLGLTIANMLIEAMGGAISVRSTPGAGSCFTVTLPVQKAGDVAGPVTVSPAALPDLKNLDGKRVLVAEDNRVNRMLIDKYLAPTAITFSFAHDGRQAVAMSQSERPDLVFMDMSMPVLNGIDATREIRARGDWQPKIVALTANAFSSDREACIAAGMDGFLSKPVRKADLLACLAEHLTPASPRAPP